MKRLKRRELERLAEQHVLDTSQYTNVEEIGDPAKNTTDVSARCQRCKGTWRKEGLSDEDASLFLRTLRSESCEETK